MNVLWLGIWLCLNPLFIGRFNKAESQNTKIFQTSVVERRLISVYANTFQQSAAKGRLVIEFTTQAPLKGKLAIALYNSAKGFPSDSSKAVGKWMVPVKKATETFTTPEFPVGEYALSVYHDQNSDGVLNTNFIGLPKEPYGVSNNKKNPIGPPRWKDAVFQLKAGENKLFVTLD